MALVRRTVLAVFLLGCGSTPSAPAPGTSSLDQATAMLRHEALGLAIRDAVVNGDLATARRDADLLGKVMYRRHAPDAHLAKMRAATNEIADAADLDSAAHGTSDLVASCADCHAGRRPERRDERRLGPPPPGMHRHAWAVNELWDGLVDGSEERWQAGAESLADPANTVRPTAHAAENAESFGRLITALGRRAETSNATPARAVIYGELIETCAACHTATRR